MRRIMQRGGSRSTRVPGRCQVDPCRIGVPPSAGRGKAAPMTQRMIDARMWAGVIQIGLVMVVNMQLTRDS